MVRRTGWNLVECEMDLRVGGTWRYLSVGHYVDQSFPGESLITIDLEQEQQRTTLRSTVRFPSEEVRDVVISRPWNGA